jgi:hypothetical protein
MNEEAAYQLTSEDREAIEEAAEWFLGTRKPRTAPEVRGVLVKLYLTGMATGIRATRDVLEEEL